MNRPLELRAEGLGLQRAGRTLCKNLNLRIRAGECWCILGRNGSGKTTLLHNLAGIETPHTGTVLLQNEPIQKVPRRRLAKTLGLLPQDHSDAFPANVLQTVLLGRHPHLGRWQWEGPQDLALAQQALSKVGLEHFQQRELETLSGGERRRVGIATLLTQDPSFLLLDEPTNHLDLHHQIRILEQLSKAARENNKALVMVLHDLNLASRFGDHFILLFDDGQAMVGNKDEALQQQHLERLLGHPLQRIEQQSFSAWLPR